MKIAVTGASGFLGRYVLQELEKRNISTIAVSRSEKDNNSSNDSNVQWVQLDIAHHSDSYFKQLYEPDILIHLAWDGLPNYKSLHHFERELPFHYKFIATLVREGLQNIIATGTCFEYGMQSGPLSSNIETRPQNPYSFAKDTLHKQLQYLKSIHHFNLTWARLFYMYGEGQSESSLFSSLKKAIDSDQKIFDMSGGEQLRDYLPVQDVAKQLVDMAVECKNRGAVNICSGSPVSVRKLVESWIADYGWDIELRLGTFPYPDYEPMAFWGIKEKK